MGYIRVALDGNVAEFLPCSLYFIFDIFVTGCFDTPKSLIVAVRMLEVTSLV